MVYLKLKYIYQAGKDYDKKVFICIYNCLVLLGNVCCYTILFSSIHPLMIHKGG